MRVMTKNNRYSGTTAKMQNQKGQSYLKNNVFKNRSGTIPELMQVITDNCNLMDVPTLRRSFAKRVALCLEAEGRHFEYLL
jgi:hypothetical protein